MKHQIQIYEAQIFIYYAWSAKNDIITDGWQFTVMRSLKGPHIHKFVNKKMLLYNKPVFVHPMFVLKPMSTGHDMDAGMDLSLILQIKTVHFTLWQSSSKWDIRCRDNLFIESKVHGRLVLMLSFWFMLYIWHM